MEISEDDGHDDMELLSLIMETRESLEEAVTQEHVDQIRHSNNQLRSDTVQSLDSAFNNQQWHQAKLLAIKLRYLNNVENVCREWMPGQEIVLQH